MIPCETTKCIKFETAPICKGPLHTARCKG